MAVWLDSRRGAVRAAKALAAAIVTAALVGGCHQDMWSQPKAKAQSKNDMVFADSSNSRPTVPGTVAYGKADLDHEFETGYDRNGHLVKEFPMPVTPDLVKRGQDRFRIFCTPCHGELGDGQGFIAKRGFTQARPVGNYLTERLRNMPIGHFFDVITNGYGTMFPYRSRIVPYDRWAIASYIRVLQVSAHTPVSEIPADKQAELNAMKYTPDQDAPKELPIGPPPARELNAPGGQAGNRVASGMTTIPAATNGGRH